MESLAHHEIDFNLVVFAFLAFLLKTTGNQLKRVPRDTPLFRGARCLPVSNESPNVWRSLLATGNGQLQDF